MSSAVGTQREAPMLGIVALVLVVLWVLGFLVFKVAGIFIHLLLLAALVSVIMHFMRGRRVT
jgi:hypothetical protein